MISRYDSLFQQLSEKNEGAFVPFVTLGDPDLDTSFEIVKTLIDNGADALELGFPFSDPIADGPTIQAANIRALEHQVTPEDCLALIQRIRNYDQNIPIGLLLYSNLVMAKGITPFYQDCAKAGIDSVLIADVPVHESKPFRIAAVEAGVSPIFVSPPNADDDTVREIATRTRGYTYLLSRAGVTGTETQAALPQNKLIETLKLYHAAPALLGFGISQPLHVKQAIAAGAAGAICGSAIVKIIENHLDDKQALYSHLGEFVKEMKAATRFSD
ncbi:tryptophan synthase subunit alpha [Algicola sagamiensis]|uniref:tryptophan synthase subunit alpha n=1 Tax=Algicola sagamiensis TaxID=163869 RepID=UPI00036BA417